MKGKQTTDGSNIIFLGFADNQKPEFVEVKNKEYILFGADNIFPDKIIMLYDKSSVHGAIINNKVKYIIGSGINIEGNDRLKKVNRYGESINKILEKSCKDIELFGGFYWQVIYDLMGGIKEIVHTPFQSIRKGKDKGWFYCQKWDWSKHKKVDPVYIDDYDSTNSKGVQLFSYREYRPGDQEYPLPGYFSALNDIETDTEISIYNLSVMKNGQFTGKLISFFSGVPNEEKQKELEKRWNSKFNGTNNAGRTMLAFNNGTDKPPQVDDLSSTDLDKLFDQLRKSTEGKIFAGHEVTSPVLFGIMQPGSLGTRTEMQDSYEIFKNTYANAKQQAIEEILSIFLPLLGQPVQKLIPVAPLAGAAQPGTPGAALETNDNLKNMTGRQFQGMQRIITKYRNGKLDKAAAALLLKNSFGLGDEDIETMLAAESAFEKDFTEIEVAEMFAACGTKRDEFEIVRSRRFSHDDMEMTFADVKGNDASILDLIKKDKRITPKIIAQTLDVKTSYVVGRIKALTEKGILIPSTSKIGVDTIIEHSINRENIDKIDKPETIDISIKYSYEVKPGVGPELIPTSRPFCKRLIELDRLYSRAEIESISQMVGFSVWDRKGGWWGENPECRHNWFRHVVIKKRKS